MWMGPQFSNWKERIYLSDTWTWHVEAQLSVQIVIWLCRRSWVSRCCLILSFNVLKSAYHTCGRRGETKRVHHLWSGHKNSLTWWDYSALLLTVWNTECVPPWNQCFQLSVQFLKILDYDCYPIQQLLLFIYITVRDLFGHIRLATLQAKLSAV